MSMHRMRRLMAESKVYPYIVVILVRLINAHRPRPPHAPPAVGGTPKDSALEWISRLEDFDRGWYAGPIGWITRDSAEFAVALRCGVLAGDTLSLFSGAGLVEGSEPGDEWLEIEQKITDFTHILGLEVKSSK